MSNTYTFVDVHRYALLYVLLETIEKSKKFNETFFSFSLLSVNDTEFKTNPRGINLSTNTLPTSPGF